MKKKSNILSVCLILFSVFALVFYIGFVDGFSNVLNIFLHCNKFWFLFGFFIMFCFWYLDYYILNRALKIFKNGLDFSNGIKNCMLGQFFNNITPSATGGQPFQAFFMNKHCKIKYGVAVGALLIKFLCFQIALTCFCGLVVFLKFQYFVRKIQGFAFLMLIGFTINFLVAVALIFVGINKKIVVFFISFFVKILAKLKIFKGAEEKLIDIKKEVDTFNETILNAFKEKKYMLSMIFFSLLQLLSLYFINIVVALVFGMYPKFSGIFNVISAAACVHMGSIFVPLPGAVGGAEFLFCVIYDGIFSEGRVSAALLLWRIYTFYFPIIVGLFFSRSIFKKKIRN